VRFCDRQPYSSRRHCSPHSQVRDVRVGDHQPTARADRSRG